MGPMRSNMMRQREPIHVAGHLDVGKHQYDIVCMNIEERYRFVARARFMTSKAGLPEDMASVHQDQGIVVNDKSIGFG
ncbi:hypothetical protein GCM10008023_38800 [Sphingomonas glacialis]|uniref:Uncharacterized protein n=1 Tax=Sphingomonas glacialis TaxID=658225 RepID=A0ABQ3LWI8_9SPHN|nr:hypothetical protein GCM10008023_38800 [Sphingomonas glacialis]